MRHFGISVCLVVSAGALGCSNDDQRACAPGDVRVCSCPGGLSGTQTCRSDGKSWQSCAGCLSSSDASNADSNGGRGGDAGSGARVGGGTQAGGTAAGGPTCPGNAPYYCSTGWCCPGGENDRTDVCCTKNPISTGCTSNGICGSGSATSCYDKSQCLSHPDDGLCYVSCSECIDPTTGLPADPPLIQRICISRDTCLGIYKMCAGESPSFSCGKILDNCRQ
jgi:hypothetical protein